MSDTPSAELLRARAADSDRKAAESFERSDTDGFVTQWALGISAREDRLQASIQENGGLHDFRGLYTVEGERVRAKAIQTKYGSCWALVKAGSSEFTGEFVPRCFEEDGQPGPRTKMAKMGLCEKWEQAPAKAATVGHGRGLSGAASVQVVARRQDDGFPEDARSLEQIRKDS